MTAPDPLVHHGPALEAYVAAALAMDETRWHVPARAGGWTPAEITEHLRLVYVIGQQELAGGAGMRIRLRWPTRFVLRLTVVRRLRRGGRFPEGAPAPRELRPAAAADASRATLLDRLRTEADRFQAAAAEVRRTAPGRRMTHPYFGKLPLDDMITIVVRHLDHHRAQLPARAHPERAG
jgi:hypothetical protein